MLGLIDEDIALFENKIQLLKKKKDNINKN